MAERTLAHMIAASIFIGPPGRGEDIPLPPRVQENIASLQRHHPELPHRLFSHDDIVEFIEARFPPEVLGAFNTLRPHAYKADLARYCILYELGGIYADLSYYFVRPLPFDGAQPVVFRDLFCSAPWDTSNSVFAAPPGHSAFERAIDMVCDNVRRQYYGPTFLCPTGPALFGKAVAMTCYPDDLITGTSRVANLEMLCRSFPGVALPGQASGLQCMAFGETVVAIKRKQGVGRLKDLGIAGADDYTVHWKNRDIYVTPAAAD